MRKGHHGSTYPAGKMLPREGSISHVRKIVRKMTEDGSLCWGLRSHHINNRAQKRKHTRKSRQWLKREIRRDVDIYSE